MPPDTNRSVESLQKIARDASAGRRPTVAELWDMPLPAALDCVRAEVRDARLAMEAQLSLALEEGSARRVGIIQTYLADLAESEARLKRCVDRSSP